jgi:hypothetical protein
MKTKRHLVPRPQFALRTLALGGLLVGTVAGLWGPKMAKSIRTWLEPPPAKVQQPFVLPMTQNRGEWDPSRTGYYESAETPLQ